MADYPDIDKTINFIHGDRIAPRADLNRLPAVGERWRAFGETFGGGFGTVFWDDGMRRRGVNAAM